VQVVIDTGSITGQRYHCQDCDYLGSFIVEEELPDAPGTPP
jgi:transposase-like protein